MKIQNNKLVNKSTDYNCSFIRTEQYSIGTQTIKALQVSITAILILIINMAVSQVLADRAENNGSWFGDAVTDPDHVLSPEKISQLMEAKEYFIDEVTNRCELDGLLVNLYAVTCLTFYNWQKFMEMLLDNNPNYADTILAIEAYVLDLDAFKYVTADQPLPTKYHAVPAFVIYNNIKNAINSCMHEKLRIEAVKDFEENLEVDNNDH